MNKVFVKTKNVKNFVSLMEEVKQLPNNIPKIILVYGEYGLGKSETIKWWTFKNDCIYVRANQGMTSRWLLSEIAEELGEEPFWHIQETFNLIEKKLKENPKPIIIDEVDYLLERNTIETLRDLYDTTSCPLVLVGMGNIDKKLSRYPHIIDRIYKSFKFERYDFEDVKQILNELTQITFTPDGVEYLATRVNQFRQIVKLINKIEKLAITNQLKQIDENILKSSEDKTFSLDQKAEFTTIYCYLLRNLTHNTMAYNLNYKIAETLWRRKREFKDLYYDLKMLIGV